NPSDPMLANAITNRAEGLLAVGRHAEALADLARATSILGDESQAPNPRVAGILSAVGRTKLAMGDCAGALAPLERAREIYERFPGAGTIYADVQFALARSLWDCSADRRRAAGLAESARATYATRERNDRATLVSAWKSSHPSQPRR